MAEYKRQDKKRLFDYWDHERSCFKKFFFIAPSYWFAFRRAPIHLTKLTRCENHQSWCGKISYEVVFKIISAEVPRIRSREDNPD